MIAQEMLNDVSYVAYRTSPRTFQRTVFQKLYTRSSLHIPYIDTFRALLCVVGAYGLMKVQQVEGRGENSPS